jgi:hypothetical protein
MLDNFRATEGPEEVLAVAYVLKKKLNVRRYTHMG